MSDTNENYLLFAGQNNEPEMFYTLEGEGRYAGYPSVFIRLFGCNLTCAAFATKDSPFGCDSYISWSQKNKLTFNEIFKMFEDRGYIEKLANGAIFKITGGEPLLRQSNLLEFMKAFVQKYEFRPQIDFETNGTVMPDMDWVNLFEATFTVSPKLTNNGDPEEKRYKPEVLKKFVELHSCFKFVVKSPEDINEILTKYVSADTCFIPRKFIWLMPCCGSREEQNQTSLPVAELCKEYGFKFSPRLQLLIWNKALKK